VSHLLHSHGELGAIDRFTALGAFACREAAANSWAYQTMQRSLAHAPLVRSRK
jgi:hypothetical protein